MNENGVLTEADVEHKALIVFVGKNYKDGLGKDELYQSANFAWRVKKERAEKADIVLAVCNREVLGVFVPDVWIEADKSEKPRYWFSGQETNFRVQQQYVGKRLEDDLRGYGGGARYVNC